jgi:radical SAM superfamily enzyme YgiQ (UPF0313 family)
MEAVIAMKIVLCAIDAKYIHPNLALRLLKANCPLFCDLREHTIKDAPESIAADILRTDPDLVAFSVYLWNIGIVRETIRLIRLESRALIVAGGPEVGHDAETHMRDGLFDFIICGEGEIAFERLVEALATGVGLDRVPNLVYRTDDGIACNPVVRIRDLACLASPYRFIEDDPGLPHRIQYMELSRGCPFSCSYCVAPLDGPVRRFPIARVEQELVQLMDRGAKTFKFLDRTFNLQPDIAKNLLDFIIANHRPGCVFQFEIQGDILPESLIRHLNECAPAGLLRFEIGIQSTNDDANRAVSRHQNNEVLFSNVRTLIDGGRIIVHLDLIAGLPHETLASFIRGFDETFGLFAPELQVGFLKMLRGTPLRRDSRSMNYVFDPDPPYGVVRSDAMEASDLDRIRRVETIVDRFWNKGYMNEAFRMIYAAVPSMFAYMEGFHHHLEKAGFDVLRGDLAETYRVFNEYAEATLPDKSEVIFDSLKYAYLDRAKTRPKIWWSRSDSARSRDELLRTIHAKDPSLPLEDLHRYGLVTTYGPGHLLVLFTPKGKIMRVIA